MSFISRFLRRDESDQPPMLRMVYIYFNDTTVVVASTCTFDRRNAPLPPIHRFRRDIAMAELGQCIIDSMATSDLDTPEDTFNEHLSEFFAFMNIPGWRALEAEWYHIEVLELSESEFEVYEFQKCKGGGYASERQPIRVPANSEMVGRQVVASMGANNSEYYDDGGPSHT